MFFFYYWLLCNYGLFNEIILQNVADGFGIRFAGSYE
jgi:hypothetical protein